MDNIKITKRNGISKGFCEIDNNLLPVFLSLLQAAKVSTSALHF